MYKVTNNIDKNVNAIKSKTSSEFGILTDRKFSSGQKIMSKLLKFTCLIKTFPIIITR